MTCVSGGATEPISPSKVTDLAIRQILADGAFDQGAIDLMTESYDAACKELALQESKYAAANETVARTVMQLVRDGQRDAAEIARRVVEATRAPRI